MKKEWIDILLAAVYEASETILEIYNSDFEVIIKEDKSPVTEADKRSSQIISKHLEPLGIGIVSEEETHPELQERIGSSQIWMVDPIDGTKEFVRKNDQFCICIALIENNRSTFGMIADPIKQEVIFGGPSIEAAYHISFHQEDYFDQAKLELKIPEKKSLVYSSSHFSPKAKDIISKIESIHGEMDISQKGSALKFFDLALSKAQFYPRLAPTMEWDIAAGQAIYEAIGGEVVDFTNFMPLTYNKEDLYNPFFIAKPKDLQIR